MSFVMAGIVPSAFLLHFAMGRSTFAAPLLVHLHAVVFMGWVALYVAQNAFAVSGAMPLHRRLGWIGAGWVVLMVILGTAATVAMVRRGQAPFFFQPVQFLVLNPIAILTFAGLTAAAITLRRRTSWHRRLHYCGMAMLLAPAFGRLLPMPLLVPWAYEATVIGTLALPVIGMAADARRGGAVHPAWWWGVAVMLGSVLLTETISTGPAGEALYRAVTAGSPGASVSPFAYPPPPAGPLITGR